MQNFKKEAVYINCEITNQKDLNKLSKKQLKNDLLNKNAKVYFLFTDRNTMRQTEHHICSWFLRHGVLLDNVSFKMLKSAKNR